MDIAKAFDTVDHSKMLQKLQIYGFSGSVLLWFKNYLCGRLQRVTVHGATSQSLPISIQWRAGRGGPGDHGPPSEDF